MMDYHWAVQKHLTESQLDSSSLLR